MIVDSAQLDGRHLVLSSDPAKISPDAGFDLWSNPVDAIFRAENDVKIDLRVRVCHTFQSSLQRRNILNTNLPWVQTHGYIQVSLRDRSRSALQYL